MAAMKRLTLLWFRIVEPRDRVFGERMFIQYTH
jgi:hypothetical protein